VLAHVGVAAVVQRGWISADVHVPCSPTPTPLSSRPPPPPQILDEVDRSIHDALCVVRSLVKKRYLIVGGGAPEIEMALQARQGIGLASPRALPDLPVFLSRCAPFLGAGL
jgi:hypothetical protein